MSGFGELPAPPVDRRSALDDLLDRRRLLLILGILVIEMAIFAIGLLTPISPSTQQILANETRTQFGVVNSLTPVQLMYFLFAHNLPIALAELIPVLGAGLFALSIYGTGLVAQASIVSQGRPAIVGVILFLFPYSYVELSSYAISVGAGIMIIVALVKRRFRRELRVLLLEAIVITAFLLVAAAMESTTIAVSTTVGFALWLPTGLALAGIILIARRSWSRSTAI
jgi:Stage II sporulation protein M